MSEVYFLSFFDTTGSSFGLASGNSLLLRRVRDEGVSVGRVSTGVDFAFFFGGLDTSSAIGVTKGSPSKVGVIIE